MIVDRLNKCCLYKLFETLQIIEFINAIYQKIFAIYGFSLTIINNWEYQMILILWKCLYKRYSISIKFFLAHHLETDSWTENTNRKIKNYLCTYINYIQDDWVNNLPIAEFAASNHVNVLITMTLFFTNHEFYPYTNIKPSDTYNSEQKTALLATNQIVKR